MSPSTAGVAFSKGHGTQNDFVVLPDPDASLDLTPARVAALCDRRRGLGADGVLRVVRWAKLAERSAGATSTGTGTAGVPDPEPGAEWFMDYRNADGSAAEMCGNGVRVFARYLYERGWGGEGPLGTRAGVRTVTIAGSGADTVVSVGMGPARIGAESTAVVDGVTHPGVAIDVGNPHLACVGTTDPDTLDLTRPPSHDSGLFPHGVNVEFVTPIATGPEGDAVRMRVHERGVGETRSCGTGTVAAVVAALRAAGRDAGDVAVATPGGALRVTVEPGATTLHGPAELIAHGELDRTWWDSLGPVPDRAGESRRTRRP
ncbi:diaminopimelate epimerase [Pseudonocardia sp. KRD291]|uniref:diaminopimelate epimerase n=1 Tax=Pseudonocardia sp. KRD291 TaxID=2792007 RepID=UPI001C4A4786|nr:diaminopimelate epimerase [Pseudonocardia sp. KRD291]MBW0104726.1 diaminopimelate epimerase [Pseudonocardia sp. KRD291]